LRLNGWPAGRRSAAKMSDHPTDIEADISATIDRGEGTGLMEPLLIGESSRHRGVLTDLTVELAAKAAVFRRSLPGGVRTALADLVRAMNCYYSNLIEGHDTHPVDIERALNNDYSTDARKHDLQIEAKAHITGAALDRFRRPHGSLGNRGRDL